MSTDCQIKLLNKCLQDYQFNKITKCCLVSNICVEDQCDKYWSNRLKKKVNWWRKWIDKESQLTNIALMTLDDHED